MHRIALLGALALGLFASQALADQAPSVCIDVSVPKGAILAHDGKWIELTHDQWEFMRGVFAMDPETPKGLPYGDRAVLAQVEGGNSGIVFFIDDNKACTPIRMPPELVAMLRDVASGEIGHEGVSN